MKKLRKLLSVSFLSLSLLALSFGTYAQNPGAFPGCNPIKNSPTDMEGICVYYFGEPFCDTGIGPHGNGTFDCYVAQQWF